LLRKKRESWKKEKTEYEIRVCEKIERKKSFGYLLIVHFEHWRNVKYKLYPCDVSREDSTHHFISFLLSLLNSRYHWSSTGGGYSIIYFIDFFLSILHSEYKLFQPRKDQTCITVHATDFGSVDNKITGKLIKPVSITSNIFDKPCA
jgi:hypothetical protein